MLPRRLVPALVFLAWGTAAFAGVNEWTPTGAPGGSATAMAFSPHQQGLMLAGAGWGLYRSINSGQEWTTIREGVLFGGASSIVFDPANGSRVMVATINRLYRSDDAGLNYQVIGGPPGTGSPGTVRKLVFARDGSVLYAVTHTNKVFRTVNFGTTWEDRSGTLPSSSHMTDLVVDPNSATTLYVLSESGGLFRSVDGGGVWTSINHASFAGAGLRKLAIDPANSQYLLLATNDGGLLESRDSGVGWAVEDPNPYFAWVGFHDSGVGAAIAIGNGRVIRRVSRDAAWTAGGSVNAGNFFGAVFDPRDADPIGASSLFVLTSGEPLFSADGGATFAVRSQGLRGSSVTHLSAADDGTIYAAYSEGPTGIHKRSAGVWAPVNNAALFGLLQNFFNPLVMAADATSSGILLVGSNAELARSQDGGQSWTLSADANVAGRLPRSLTFSRGSPQYVYLGLDDGHGVAVSADAGLSWQARSNGLPSGVNGTSGVGALAIDPARSSIAYAGLLIPQAQPVLYKTTDAGLNWVARSDGLDVVNLQTIAIARSSHQIIYAGAAAPGQGVVRSENAGQTWERVGAPINNGFAVSVEVDPVVPTALYMTANLATGGAARSVDGGVTWENLPQGVLGLGLLGKMVLDPQQPGRMLAAAPHYGLMEFTVAPDLEATLTVSPVVAIGASETATVSVRNLGPFAASTANLRITLPPGVTGGVPSPQQGMCGLVGAAFECAFGALRVGQTVATTVTLTAGGAPASGSLTASVTARESDPALANNQASAPVTVTRVANMVALLGTSATTVAQGAAVTLTAIARNDGPQESPATELIVDVGAGFTYQSASATQGSCTASAARVTCTLGALANAATASATINVIAANAGTLSASATVTTSVTDAVAANNTAVASVTSQAPAPAGGGGGGGASSVAELLFLLAALLVVTWRRESRAPSGPPQATGERRAAP